MRVRLRLYLRVISEVCLGALLPDKLGILCFSAFVFHLATLALRSSQHSQITVMSSLLLFVEVFQSQMTTIVQTFDILFVFCVLLSFPLSSQLRAPSSLALPSRGERAEMGKGLEDNLRKSGKPLYRRSIRLCFSLSCLFISLSLTRSFPACHISAHAVAKSS